MEDKVQSKTLVVRIADKVQSKTLVEAIADIKVHHFIRFLVALEDKLHSPIRV